MENDTVIRLRRVVLRLARQLNAASREEGLTPTQASVLQITSTRGPLSLAELTELEGINPTMLSRVVGKLDAFGLIKRLRDPDDFRAARVEVTPEGQRVYERISAQRNAIISECVADLPADQEAALVAALSALENLADKLRATVRGDRNNLIRDNPRPARALFAQQRRLRPAVPRYFFLLNLADHLAGTGGQYFAIFADGHKRQLPRLTGGPFRYKTYAADTLAKSLPMAHLPMKQAVIAPSMLALLYPLDEEIPGYTQAQFEADLVNECEKDIRQAFAAGAARVSVDFTEGRLATRNDARNPWTGRGMLPHFIELNNRVMDRFSADERSRIGIHTCPGGDRDSVHSAAGRRPSGKSRTGSRDQASRGEARHRLICRRLPRGRPG